MIFSQAKEPAYKDEDSPERKHAIPALPEHDCRVLCHVIMIASIPVRPACKYFIGAFTQPRHRTDIHDVFSWSRGNLTDKEREERRLRKELEKAERLLSKHQAREEKENVKQAEREERDRARDVARRNASRMAMEDLQVRSPAST
jgi:hypothetical protein